MTHICNICENEPGSHSFTYLYRTQKKEIYEYVFYTCVGDAKKYNDTSGIMDHYRNTLTTMNPDMWIWVFNCDGFTFRHYTEVNLIKKIAELIRSYGKVEAIYLVNTPSILSLVLNIVKPILGSDIYKKIKSLNPEQAVNEIDLEVGDKISLTDLLVKKY